MWRVIRPTTRRPTVAPVAMTSRCEASISGNGGAPSGGAVEQISRGGLADVREVRQLASLPQTEAELRNLAAALGAPADSVVLGAEATEARVRNARHDANDLAKKGQQDGLLTEDDLKRVEKEIQAVTDTSVKEIDQHAAHKEKEILTV